MPSEASRPGCASRSGVAEVAPDGAEAAFLHGRPAPGAPIRDLDPDLRLRAASITKGALGRLAAVLGAEGALDLGAPHPLPPRPARHARGAPLPHRRASRRRRLPSPRGRDAARARPRAPAPAPGGFFYANLNALLAAQILEEATGERIDRLLAGRVLGPAGIGGGLNWGRGRGPGRAPAALAAARRGVHPPRRTGRTGHGPRTRSPGASRWRSRPTGPAATRRCCPPHAGLRASLPELARLARAFGTQDAAGRLQRRTLWRASGPGVAGGRGRVSFRRWRSRSRPIAIIRRCPET